MENNRTLEKHLLLVAKTLKKFLSKSLINAYAVIGGIAVGAIGVPRATKDIDFLVTTSQIDKLYKELKNIFSKKGYLLKYARPEGNIFPYHSIIFSLKEKSGESKIVDVLVSTKKWQDEISTYTASLNYEDEAIPIVNTEGLIILKLKAGGKMDIIDVENILNIVDFKKLDKKILFDWAKRSGVDKLLHRILIDKKLI
ncbi:MAG: hypothetical protein ABII74_03200 [Elusimicrobiota bacterium]